MSRAPKLLEDMRRSPSGWSQDDFRGVLEYYGYEKVREARHGALYRHPLLAGHPDLQVRMTVAQVVIPKGRSLRDYVARDVVASIDALRRFEIERTNAEKRS